MTAHTARRAEALAALAGEVQRLIRDAIGQPQGELFHQNRTTREAREARHTVTMSVREAGELVRAALPTSGRDTTAQLRNAMLVVALRYALDTVCAIDSTTPTPEAIAAAAQAGRQLRNWLRAAEKPRVRRSNARPVPKQGRLLLPIVARRPKPVNIIAVTAHEARPLHNAVPLRSAQPPGSRSAEPDFSQSGTTDNDSPATTRKTA